MPDEKSQQVAIRIPVDLLSRVDAIVHRLQSEDGFLFRDLVTRTAVLREAVRRGVEDIEKETGRSGRRR